ncbi:SAM-dependent methyltransferase [Streptomyces pathocidini]|uniref:SAM-dependent methyltransferase n=1 Tax=Streptomyces pathocidini TaxID=1650571 RepID=A0ABW7UY15_9ACTN|nr:SAM-dependent methyltransferase [Streptomyces pathocidini]
MESYPPAKVFPTRQDHDSRWRSLARGVAENSQHVSDDPAVIRKPEKIGDLTIIGSGIEAVGFTSVDESLIKRADYVFFCVADPATSVWIKSIRPDAYDLYVLYDDSKLRYLTYIQMSEAILHYVRRGAKVVAIYYGHPGVFVFSTHRAVQIARREGHKAVMRANVSALDTLCADLGVDPSQPGMQTFEATDMLIRQRQIDTGLHLILWQVGLIGELGYRRQGYLNNSFSVLLDYIEEAYGSDYPIVNYIGSRYPGIDPTKDQHTVSSLRVPEAQSTVTGISTFYIPPKRPSGADRTMLEKLGLIKPGQSVRTSQQPLREMSRYGPREMKAFEDFSRFKVPPSYHWQDDTPAAHFILALRNDADLCSRYVEDPSKVVSSWGHEKLSSREKDLLSRRDAGAMQLAAKGSSVKTNSDAELILRKLITKRSRTRALFRSTQNASNGDVRCILDSWSRDCGYSVDWDIMPAEFGMLLREKLYPWTGYYLSRRLRIGVYILGSFRENARNQIFLNGREINEVYYSKGTLRWSADDGNTHSGFLRTQISTNGVRKLVGAVWSADDRLEDRYRLSLNEYIIPASLPLAGLAGSYQAVGAPYGIVTISPDLTDSSSPKMRVYVDGKTLESPIRVGASTFDIDGFRIPFESFRKTSDFPKYFEGIYVAKCLNKSEGLLNLTLNPNTIKPLDESAAGMGRQRVSTTWTGKDQEYCRGDMTLMIDPITLHPMMFGKVYKDGNSESTPVTGMVPVSRFTEEKLKSEPHAGMPDWAWSHLVEIACTASRRGGLFLWHNWQNTSATVQMIHRMFEEV